MGWRDAPEAPITLDGWQSAPEEPARPFDVNPSVASAMNVANGLTFGFAPRIFGRAAPVLGATANAANDVANYFGIPFLDKPYDTTVGGEAEYDDRRRRFGATVRKFKEDDPLFASSIGTVSSAMLPGLLAAKAINTAPVVSAAMEAHPWITAAGSGAVNTAAQSAGDSENASDMPRNALVGAALGTIGGPLIKLGLGSVANTVGAAGSFVGSHVPFINEAVTKALAYARAATALNRDGIAPDAVRARLADLGPEGRIFDLGANSRRALDVNATLPGETKNLVEDLIEQRISGRPARMDPAVDIISGGQGRAGDVLRNWEKQQQVAAGPLYARAHSLTVPQSPELLGQLDALRNAGAFKEAASLANANQTPFSLGLVLDGPTPMGPNMTPKLIPLPMGELDNVKQGADDIISRLYGSNPKSQVAGAVNALKNRYLGTLDAATIDPTTGVSIYGAARRAFEEPAKMISALNTGRSALSRTADETSTLMDGLSKAEQDAYRIGAAENARHKFGSQSGQTEYLNQWKNRNIQENLEAILQNPEKLAGVMRILKNEQQLKLGESVGRGSQTAERHAGMEDQTTGVAGDVVGLLGKAKDLGLSSLLGGITKFSAYLGTPEPVRNAIGGLLMSHGTEKELAALAKAQIAAKNRAVAKAILSGAGAGEASAAGMSAYNSFTGQ